MFCRHGYFYSNEHVSGSQVIFSQIKYLCKQDQSILIYVMALVKKKPIVIISSIINNRESVICLINFNYKIY